MIPLNNKIKFSIIIHSLNPGNKLAMTLESIENQNYDKLEVIVQDGFSRDKSIENIVPNEWTKIYAERDKGVFDALNKGIKKATGDFVLFMECGDVFVDSNVLNNVEAFILKEQKLTSYNPMIDNASFNPAIYYGKQLDSSTGLVIDNMKKITGFEVYSNLPRRSTGFFEINLLRQRPFDISYRLLADYDLLLWSFFKEKVNIQLMDFNISKSFSSEENIERADRSLKRVEFKTISEKYIQREELLKYIGMKALTFGDVKKKVVGNKTFSEVYKAARDVVAGKKE